MANNAKQIKYNQAIDNIAYLIINYKEPLKQLLVDYGISFKGNPADQMLSDAIVEQLEDGEKGFEEDLEVLINKLTATDEDQFFGSILKGAVGLVGGLIRKKKNKRRARRAARASASQDRSYANAQALAAKRDLERRMRRQREEQRRRQAEARRRREEEERRRREKQERDRKEAEAKKKTNMMLMIGGGVVVLGIGAAMFMKSNRPPMPYPQMRPPAVPV